MLRGDTGSAIDKLAAAVIEPSNDRPLRHLRRCVDTVSRKPVARAGIGFPTRVRACSWLDAHDQSPKWSRERSAYAIAATGVIAASRLAQRTSQRSASPPRWTNARILMRERHGTTTGASDSRAILEVMANRRRPPTGCCGGCEERSSWPYRMTTAPQRSCDRQLSAQAQQSLSGGGAEAVSLRNPQQFEVRPQPLVLVPVHCPAFMLQGVVASRWHDRPARRLGPPPASAARGSLLPLADPRRALRRRYHPGHRPHAMSPEVADRLPALSLRVEPVRLYRPSPCRAAVHLVDHPAARTLGVSEVMRPCPMSR